MLTTLWSEEPPGGVCILTETTVRVALAMYLSITTPMALKTYALSRFGQMELCIPQSDN